jgi:hypothetical protein
VSRFADVAQAGEQVLIQHIHEERAVEAFDVGVLIGLAGPDVMAGGRLSRAS